MVSYTQNKLSPFQNDKSVSIKWDVGYSYVIGLWEVREMLNSGPALYWRGKRLKVASNNLP